jgi:hypothetical protein
MAHSEFRDGNAGVRPEKVAPPFDNGPYETPERAGASKVFEATSNEFESSRCLGHIHFDEEALGNHSVPVCVTEDGRPYFRRDLYVSITDGEQGIEFLGRVVEGPFYAAAESEFAGGIERDGPYGITGVVEVVGQLEEGVRLLPTATRPRPTSVVRAFAGRRLRQLLGIEGDYYLGRLIGAEAVPVHLQSRSKNFLPRNIGIFGTVGSGKSNTMQVLMEEAIQAGWAVVVIDVEGEYVRMCDAVQDERMESLLRLEHGLEPQGISDFRVYVPASGRSGAADSRPFKVPMSAIEPEIVADILEFSDPHVRMFEAASRNAASRNEFVSRQSSPSRMPGEPRGVQPTMLPDTQDTILQPQRVYTLQDLIDGLQESNQIVPLVPRIRPEDLPTAASLRAKLVHLGRSDVLDWNGTAHVPELPVDEMMDGGRLSVVDVSESDDRSRNIAIAYTLQALFDRVIQTPIGEIMPTGRVRPPLLVVIEEVHTFVSRATAHRMRAVLDRLQVISRRGRKRWMALALVSQQPNHVPDELFELANTRFVHQMKSASNLAAMKSTTGGVHEALWSTVSTLGPGQCLLSGPVLKNAFLLSVRPARSHRMLSN